MPCIALPGASAPRRPVRSGHVVAFDLHYRFPGGAIGRHSARVVLVDEEHRVLLQAVVRDDGTTRFWVTPGGGIEEGETLAEAARPERCGRKPATTSNPVRSDLWRQSSMRVGRFAASATSEPTRCFSTRRRASDRSIWTKRIGARSDHRMALVVGDRACIAHRGDRADRARRVAGPLPRRPTARRAHQARDRSVVAGSVESPAALTPPRLRERGDRLDLNELVAVPEHRHRPTAFWARRDRRNVGR